MTPFLKFLLVSHVILGLLGVAAFYACWMWLLKPKPPLVWLRRASLKGTLLLILSWLTGGYYYYIYYGSAVRDVIKKGPFPWAHTVFMESKEHIFLFLPFMAIALTVAVYGLGGRFEKDPALRGAAAFAAGTIAVLGIIITLAGAVITGAVR